MIKASRSSPPLVLVEWSDATSYADWKDEEAVEKIAPEACVSVGWLIKKTKKFITIVASYSPEGKDNWSSITTIPAAFCTKIYEIKDPR